MTTPLPTTLRLRIDRMAWFFFAQLLAGLAVSLIAVAAGEKSHPFNERMFFFVLSAQFSQVTLLAAWNALGDSRQAVRPIVSFVLVFMVWLIGFALPMGFGATPMNPFIPGVAMFVQWVVVQVPLWIVRLTFRWQMGPICDDADQAKLRIVQFGIRHLIIWTTLVAIVLGVSRWMVGFLGPEKRDQTGFALFLACNSMFAWPTLLSALVHRWMPTAIVAALVFTIIVTWSEPFIFNALIGGSREGIFNWLNAIQFGWILGSMLILRAMGYRLIRPRP